MAFKYLLKDAEKHLYQGYEKYTMLTYNLKGKYVWYNLSSLLEDNTLFSSACDSKKTLSALGL